MRLELGPRLLCLCVECDEHIPHEDQQSTCSRAKIERLQAQKMNVKCAKCHRGTVDANSDDYLECRKCHTLFGTGVVVGFDTDKLETVILLDVDADQVISAVVVPGRGDGQFKIDLAIKALRRSRRLTP